jgi:hypothetical protein
VRADGRTLVGSEPHPRKLAFLYVAAFLLTLATTVGVYVWAYTTKSHDLGEFLKTILAPTLTLGSGAFVADYYHRRDANKDIERDVGNAVYSARSLLQGVYEVDERLTDAINALNEYDTPAAVRSLERAMARTDGNLLHVMQTLREWESLSVSAAEGGQANFEADLNKIAARRQQIALGRRDDVATASSEGQGAGGGDG